MSRLARWLSNPHQWHIQIETLAEIPDQMTVQVHRPVTSVVIRIQPHLTAVGATRPFLQITVIPAAADRLVTCRLRVVRVLVVFRVVLDICMNTILLIAEYIVAVGYALQQIHRLTTVVPRRL